MSRVIAVVVVAAAFSGALVYGGHAMGAWDEYKPVPDRAGTRAKAQGGAASKRAKGERRRVKSARAAKAPRNAPLAWGDRANAVCRRARPNLELLARELAGARSLDELQAVLTQLARANKRVNARLAAIPPPARQQARVRALHRLLADDERLVARMLAAIRRQDAEALRATIAATDALVRRENELFWMLGANECTLAAYLGGADTLA
jgi:hypothetical protein